MKIKKEAKNKGFTFIEMILYIAIVGFFITGAVQFAWDVIFAQEKSFVQQEVNQNLRLATQRMAFEIRNASGVNSVGADTLCLASANSTYNPTYFYVSSQRLYIGWGGGSSDCTGLTNTQTLTSNQVNVTSLSFTDLSTVGTSNISVTVTVEGLAPNNRQEWQKTQSYQTSVEIR